jgi:hypothetical protein
MKLSRLNLLTAGISLVASLVWVAIGQNAAGFIWFVCSLVWLGLTAGHLRSATEESYPMARLMRRLWRMAIWS